MVTVVLRQLGMRLVVMIGDVGGGIKIGGGADGGDGRFEGGLRWSEILGGRLQRKVSLVAVRRVGRWWKVSFVTVGKVGR